MRDIFLLLFMCNFATSTGCHLINKIHFCQTEEIEACLDKTWVVSAQSEAQKILLAEQPTDEPLTVKGPFNVYLREQVVSYFLLVGKIRPEIKDNTDPDGMDIFLNIPFYFLFKIKLCNEVSYTTII